MSLTGSYHQRSAGAACLEMKRAGNMQVVKDSCWDVSQRDAAPDKQRSSFFQA